MFCCVDMLDVKRNKTSQHNRTDIFVHNFYSILKSSLNLGFIRFYFRQIVAIFNKGEFLTLKCMSHDYFDKHGSSLTYRDPPCSMVDREQKRGTPLAMFMSL